MSGRVDIELIGDDTMSSGSDGSDSWMISYLDVLTLIIAFFVLMLALSEPISEEEERDNGTGEGGPTVVAGTGSFVLAGDSGLFEADESSAMVPAADTASVGNGSETDAEEAQPGSENNTDAQPGSPSLTRESPGNAAEQKMIESLDALRMQGVEVIAGNEGITIRLPEGLLFNSGQAELKADGLLLLDELEGFLLLFEGQISVEGHTDSFPARGSQFASNWELSTARAISVVTFLAEGSMPENRLRAVGYAATQPLERNITEEGRAANRRVELLLRSP